MPEALFYHNESYISSIAILSLPPSDSQISSSADLRGGAAATIAWQGQGVAAVELGFAETRVSISVATSVRPPGTMPRVPEWITTYDITMTDDHGGPSPLQSMIFLRNPRATDSLLGRHTMLGTNFGTMPLHKHLDQGLGMLARAAGAWTDGRLAVGTG